MKDDNGTSQLRDVLLIGGVQLAEDAGEFATGVTALYRYCPGSSQVPAGHRVRD